MEKTRVLRFRGKFIRLYARFDTTRLPNSESDNLAGSERDKAARHKAVGIQENRRGNRSVFSHGIMICMICIISEISVMFQVNRDVARIARDIPR